MIYVFIRQPLSSTNFNKHLSTNFNKRPRTGFNKQLLQRRNMCTQTETIEECSSCGYAYSIQGPIESCGLRSQQPFDSRNNNYYVGRCYGVATTSYTESIICAACAAVEEVERRN